MFEVLKLRVILLLTKINKKFMRLFLKPYGYIEEDSTPKNIGYIDTQIYKG
jgi:hypothetical protein